MSKRAKAKSAKPKASPKARATVTTASDKIRGANALRLLEKQKEAQREYNRLRRVLREAGRVEEIEEFRGFTDKRTLLNMLQQGYTYKDIKATYEDLMTRLIPLQSEVRKIQKENRDKVTITINPHKAGSEAQSALDALGGQVKGLSFRVSKRTVKELEDTVAAVNADIRQVKEATQGKNRILPDEFDIDKIKSQLTDEDSYKREIARLRRNFLNDDLWMYNVQAGDSVMTRGEQGYYQDIIDQENKRRAEAKEYSEEQLATTGFFVTQQDIETRPIDTSAYDATRYRKMAEVYTDARAAARAQIWKENYIRSLVGIRNAAINKGELSEDAKTQMESEISDIIRWLSNAGVEEIRALSLYGPEVVIYEGDYDKIPDALAYVSAAHTVILDMLGR